MEKEFTRVNIYEYVKQGMANGTLTPFVAIKKTGVLSRKEEVGTTVETWTVDANGEAYLEKTGTVGENQSVVTKTDINGEVIVQGGHVNEWIIDDAKLAAKYDAVETREDGQVYCRPKGVEQVFVPVVNDIIIDQWGDENFKIPAGGYINITNIDDFYGISAKDFNDTYVISEESPKKTLS